MCGHPVVRISRIARSVQLAVFVISALCCLTVSASAQPDLYFSEYVEGSSNNKALEMDGGCSTRRYTRITARPVSAVESRRKK
jgi:hypothetical protein